MAQAKQSKTKRPSPPGNQKGSESSDRGPDNPSKHPTSEPPEKERHYESGDGRRRPVSTGQ